MSESQIARTLDIDPKSVDRELSAQGEKGASSAKAPTGCEIENRTIVASLKSLLVGSAIFYARMARILHLGLRARGACQDRFGGLGYLGIYFSVQGPR
jgi:hypothetical protein